MGGVFQSTLPAGEATLPLKLFLLTLVISIHASRGGSDIHRQSGLRDAPISIHASRGGSDGAVAAFCAAELFQSTLPAGEATS